MLGRKEVMHCLWIATVAVVLMTSATTLPCSRESYCTDTLLQTSAQADMCIKICERKNFPPDEQNLFLLCCIGIFPSYAVSVNYTDSLHPSLFAYVKNNVKSDKDRGSVASFVRSCGRPSVFIDPRLNSSEYLSWKESESCPTRN